MKPTDGHLNKYNILIFTFIFAFAFCMGSKCFAAATMNSYCSVPPFISQPVPPLVMLDTDRSHKMYEQAYNDASDLNGDGILDIKYTHNIVYYGYFDSNKCYTYDTGNGLFTPAATTADMFCSNNSQWSGNVLNWLTMSRMDVVRKVLYGGSRSTDTSTSTVLERAYIPMDAHSWGKELTGRLCNSGTTYTNSCSTTYDCMSGYSCVDVQAAGKFLTPYATSDAPTTCTGAAVTASVPNAVLVARYTHSSSESCGVGNSQGMINSYQPSNLFNPTSVPLVTGQSTKVEYVPGFDDPSMTNTYATNDNIFAVTNFTADVTGLWSFAIDGDDDVELQVNGTVVAQYLGCHGFAGNQNNSGTIQLTSGQTYTLVARHFQAGGGEGVVAWFKRPGATSWNYVSSDLPSGASCTAQALPAPTPNKILVARFYHPSSEGCGSINVPSDLIGSYTPTAANLFNPTAVPILSGTSSLVNYVSGFDDYSLDPTSRNYADNYNIIAVTNFVPDISGLWSFAVDGDDSVEVTVGNSQIGYTSVASYLNCHGSSNGQSHSGTISLTAGTTYTLTAHHFEQGGQEGVRVWFERPQSNGNPPNTPNWLYVNSTNLSISAPTIVPGNECAIESGSFISTGVPSLGLVLNLNAPLTLSAPLIVPGNECAIETTNFITTGVPTAGATVTTGIARQNLFCNTTPSGQNNPLLRVVANQQDRIWLWSAKERPECNDFNHNPGGDYPFSVAPDDYNVRVQVCNSAVGLETDCKQYGTSYKPTGLLQKYGEGDGSKVCSKTYTVSCNTAITDSSDCAAGQGLCVYKSPIYFGMISGSYTHNLSGGVLRKNLGSMLDEVNIADGTFNSSYPGIINTYQQLQLVGYDGNDYVYDTGVGGQCGWLETGPLQDGECQNWGNPLGEMVYETLRYFAGKGAPTAEYEYSSTYDTNTVPDGGLYLPHPSWGYKQGSTTYQPYDIFPTCSKPFMLLLSDYSPNYDSDQIPGSSFAKTDGSFFAEDSLNPQLGLGVTNNGVSLLNALANTIGINEPSLASPIAGQDWFIGQSTSGGTVLYDTLCTSKLVSNLSLIRGLCPEEPTKQGTYYTAALAYYGKRLFNQATGKPNVTTYSVAMASPIADFKIKAGAGTITFVPTGKSISGCLSVKESCFDQCPNIAYNATGNGLTLGTCNAGAFCPTNQIVDFFVDDVRYDTSTTPATVTYIVFRINYEDSEQGADYDMDTIVKYEVCTQDAINNGYGSCTGTSTTLGSNVQVNMTVEYGAGCIDQILGFIISGTTADGVYLPVKDGDVPDSATTETPALIAAMPKVWSKIFTPSNAPAALLTNPLWYAAKWGGFNDINGNNIPDLTSEWAVNDGVTPDNYFLVVNPLMLETQLNNALTSVLARVSSGTASSILNNSQGSGANLLQAVFYPSKTFDNNSTASWIGEVQNLWYYLDPFFNSSTVRVDTNSDYSLDLQSDYIAHFRFDNTQSQTVVDLVHDVTGNGSNLVSVGTYPSDDPNVKSLWRAGKMLWQRNVTNSGDPRKIYTVTSSTSGASLSLFVNDGSFNADPTVKTLLQAASPTEAGAIIDFTTGIDQPGSGYRPRQVTMLNCGLSDSQGCTREWKLGDIISSTPKLESTGELQNYDQTSPNGYGDSTYTSFVASTNYQQHQMAYVGANDGMLHAFKLGILDVTGQTATHKATLRNTDGSVATLASNLGREEWAFIPRNSLPYLKYLADPTYSHIYTVDLSSTLVDASINIPSIPAPSGGCDSAHYWLCNKQTITVPGNNLDMTNTSWRTILIGGMGAGGASQNLLQSDGVTPNPCIDQVASGTCVKTPLNNVGYSSYFALDVTNPDTLPGGANPVKFMWEFNGDPANGNYLGYATTGPAIVRIGSTNLNGRWFAVFGSGPTGPIDVPTHAFQATSNQNLKLFVVDLATGALIRTIDTGISNAFAGSLSNAVIDVDKWNSQSSGFYSDDAIYVGYVQQDTTVTPNTWTKGGVVRVLTKQDTNPNNWIASTVINGIGPVTTSVTKLQDRNAVNAGALGPSPAKGKLWLYFGTGRYYYKTDALNNQYTLYGVQEPCYSSNSGFPDFTAYGPTNTFDVSGATATCNTVLTESNLQDQSGTASSAPATSLSSSAVGWYIRLDNSTLNNGYSSERVISNPLASTAGAVFFTTFAPTSDICGYGGNSNIWAVNYNTGAAPPAAAIQGKALMQVSTGALAEISLASAFSGQSNLRYDNRRTATATSGMPPSASGLALVVGPPPTKKILHYQEK